MKQRISTPDRIGPTLAALGVALTALGLTVMTGWHLQKIPLLQLLPGATPMPYNSALALFLGGAALMGAAFGKERLATVFGVLAGAIGALTLLEYLLGVNLGIDELFVAHYVPVKTFHPGRMTPNSAFCFGLAGAVFLLRGRSVRIGIWAFAKSVIGSLIIALGVAGFIGHFIGFETTYDWGQLSGMAMPTAVGFVLLGGGCLALSWKDEPRYVPITATFCLGLALSFIGFAMLNHWENHVAQFEFKEAAENQVALLRREVEGDMALLDSIRAFYGASNAIGRQDFRTFVKPLLERHVAILALEWLPRVSAELRPLFEEAARSSGTPGFRISDMDLLQGKPVPAPAREEYFPVYYLEPFEPNQQLLGLDQAAGPSRWRTMERARDEGVPAATPLLNLLRPGRISKNSAGIMVFQPVYQNGVPHGAVEERRRGLIGFAAVAFNIGDIVETAWSYLRPIEAHFYLFDKSDQSAETLLYAYASSRNHRIPPGPVVEGRLGKAGGLRYSETFEVEGRRWMVVSVPTPAFSGSSRSGQPWMLLLAGLLATLFLTVALLRSVNRAAMIERLIQERTAQLSDANRQLEREVEERKRAEASLAKRADELKAQRLAALDLVREAEEARRRAERAETEIRQKAMELARSNADLEQFAYVASHDLQEPLRMVSNYTQLLAQRYQGKLDADANAFIGFAVDGAMRMTQLIQDLLTLSQVTTWAKPLEPTDSGKVLEAVLANLRMAIEESKAEVACAQPMPTVMADTTQLMQVFQNLIGNAIKFRSDAPLQIHVGAARKDGRCEFSVSDNGIGIDLQYFDRIFHVFQRLHGRGKYPGSGIGLAVCKKIVERHGGRIWVESTPGRGSTFFFTLPGGPEKKKEAP